MTLMHQLNSLLINRHRLFLYHPDTSYSLTMVNTQRQTRSQRKATKSRRGRGQKRSQAQLADEFEFDINSTVQLAGVGTKASRKARTKKVTRPIERETRQVKKGVKKINAALDGVAKKKKKVEAKTKTAEEVADEAKKKLLEKCPKERVAELTLEAEAEAEAEAKNKKTYAKGEHHPVTAPALEALEREGADFLSHEHDTALGGMEITKKGLSKKKVKQVDANLRHSGGPGTYAGHTKEDRGVVYEQIYKDHAEQGDIGLAGHNAEKEKNINKLIQNASDEIEFVEMHRNKKGEKIGFDLKPVDVE